MFSANFVFTFLYHYLDRKESFEFDEGLFDELYYRLVDFYFMPSNMVKASAPILNLKTDYTLDIIELEEGLRIKRVSDDEFRKLFQISEQNLTKSISTIELININFIIEKLYSNRDEINWIEVKKIFDMVNIAFRLIKSGNIGFNTVILETKGWPEEWQNWSIAPAHNIVPEAPVVVVNNDDVQEIIRLWSLIKNNWEKFSIAMRRFNYAGERENEEDKLLDYAVGLESLFKISTGYGVATRVAQFVGTNRNTKYQIFDKVRSAYELRNSLIHGSSGISEAKVKAVNKNLREYLVEAIKKFLKRINVPNSSHDSIIGSEEKLMFSD